MTPPITPPMAMSANHARLLLFVTASACEGSRTVFVCKPSQWESQVRLRPASSYAHISSSGGCRPIWVRIVAI